MTSSLKRTRDDGDDTIGPHILSCLRDSKHTFSRNVKMPWERQFLGPMDVINNVFSMPAPVRELSERCISPGDSGERSEGGDVQSAFRKAGLKLVKTCDEKDCGVRDFLQKARLQYESGHL